MNALYVVGSVIYLVGTGLYLPGVPLLGGRLPTELGAWCFIVGSLFFIHACFINGAHTGDVFAEASTKVEDKRATVLLNRMKINVLLTTNFTMLGSACFLVGSVLYLPTIGCEEFTALCGTWLFILGSILFVAAGVLPIVNKHLRASSEALPFAERPASLGPVGVYAGDRGFDPLGLSGIGIPLTYMKEAEIKHGRVCM